MTKEQYRMCLTQYLEFADCELFFAWLEDNPDFIGRYEIEIQINFMMYTVAYLSFLNGVENAN